MLPGKKYSAKDIGRVAAKRGWIVLVAVVLGSAIAITVSKHLPDKFRSETLIMIIPQRIPDAYVRAAATIPTKIEDRLNSLQDQIMSRSRLERIILDLNLYESLRREVPMEDVVQRMRDDITVKTEGKESFRISYVSQQSKTAQKATERLASLFIEENLRDRENVAEDTNQFLESQLEDARRRLVEHEKKLEEYRNRFGGELPTQVTTNLQAIQNVQVQLQNLTNTIEQTRQRRLEFERQLADLQAETAVVPGTNPNAIVGETTAQRLESARKNLETAQTRLKPDHPDIKFFQRTIRDLEAKLQEEERNRPETPTDNLDGLPPAERGRQQRIRDIKRQIDDIDRQLDERQAQEQKLRAVVTEYQTKLDAVPKRESDLQELTRDYTTLQASYQSLLVKKQEAKLVADLERRNIGEQFKVLDPAKAPERPYSPNRILINLGGGGGGLVLGILFVLLLEVRDSSFKNEDEVVRLLNVRVLAVVPLMVSQSERRTRKWRLRYIGISVVVLAASGAALALWRLRF